MMRREDDFLLVVEYDDDDEEEKSLPNSKVKVYDDVDEKFTGEKVE